MSGTLVLAVGVVACALSATTVMPLKRLALRWGLTDRPGGHKVHAHATPYLGGIAIMFATVLPTIVWVGLADQRITAILLAAMAVAILGLIDDVASLPALTRLAVETVAAAGVVLVGAPVAVLGGWADGPITVMWIVVVTNSFNLLDNMDGSLAVVTTVTAAFLAGTAFVQAQPALGVLLAALSCAALGFLRHNWPPAKIFMGDSGSLFIGFVLTCSAVLLVTEPGPDAVVAGLLLPTFVATVDTGVVLFSRMMAGRPPMSGGTDHVSHRLRRLGLDTRRVAATLGLIAALTGTLGTMMALGWVAPLIAALLAGGTAIVLISLFQGVNIYAPQQVLKNPPRIRERRR